MKGSPTSPNPPPFVVHHSESTATGPPPKSSIYPLKVAPAGISVPNEFTIVPPVSFTVLTAVFSWIPK
jgi:hypothetical protein